MAKHIMPSHPDYREISWLAHLIAIAKNLSAHFRSDECMDMPEVEHKALIETLQNAQAELIDDPLFGTSISGFISTLDF